MEFRKWLLNFKKKKFISRRYVIKKDYKEYISTKYTLVKKANHDGTEGYYLRKRRYRIIDFGK